MKNVVDRNIAMRILRITRRLRRFAKPSRFRTKIACIKNNVLLFFHFWLDRCFISLIVDTCYERAIPSSFFIFTGNILAACERGARINFLPPVIFFILSFVKVFPDKWITRMACFAKSLVRAKAKSDDLSLSPKATSIFFCLFFTLTLSLFLSLSLILAYFFFLSPFPTRKRACAN